MSKIKGRKKHSMIHKKNGSSHDGRLSGSGQNGRTMPYLQSMREFVLDQFQSKTFNLSHENAKKCADEILKIVRRNHREVEKAGVA